MILCAGLSPAWQHTLEAVRIGVAAAAENTRTGLPAHIDPEAVERLRAAVRIEAA